MKIAILGSTGFIGSRLVTQALERGHEVRALARAPEKLGPNSERVEIVQGDLAKPGVLRALISGTGGVLSAAGPSNSPDQPELFERAMENLVEVMSASEIDRLVMISGAGTLVIPGENISLRRRLMHLFMRITSANRVEAKWREYKVLSSSSLKWTSVRPPIVTKDEPSGQVRANSETLPGLRIAVDDLAHFMLDQLDDDRWLGSAPLIASSD